MSIARRTIIYDGPGGPFEGVAAYDDAIEGRRPCVLVFPNVLGQKEADNLKAEALAGLGYVALAADVFGQGKRTTLQSEDRSRYMDELNADRGLLRDRLAASLEALKSLAQADPDKAAAIGFCFGGKCVLDMARAGLDILGGVSFHVRSDTEDAIARFHDPRPGAMVRVRLSMVADSARTVALTLNKIGDKTEQILRKLFPYI